MQAIQAKSSRNISGGKSGVRAKGQDSKKIKASAKPAAFRSAQVDTKKLGMGLSSSDEAYNKYLKRKHTISNSRIRPEGETFFGALLSVDMRKTAEGREILRAIGEIE